MNDPRASHASERPAQDVANILLVDDNPRNLAAIDAALSSLGQHVVKASSGGEALRALLRQDFAVVLLDVKMPGLDGFETARLIRGRLRSRYTPIIFITAYDKLEREILRGYSLGAVDFLFKPFIPEILRSKVSALVDLDRQSRLVKRQSALLREAERREHARKLLESKREWEAQALRRDMERERASAEAAARRAEELTQSDRRKDEFLAVLAHELRNPVASIHTALELFRVPDPGPETLREGTAVMGRQIRHLVRILDDLLDVARINSGRIELRKEPVEAAKAVRHAVETAGHLLAARGQKVKVDLPGRCVEVLADFTRLTQVLTNLLNNAAKYSPECANIRVRVDTEDGDVVFRVRDYGCGIPPAVLPRVFDWFAQGSKGEPGLGVGLALVRRLVEMHGGTVAASSEPRGKGSEFTVRLPEHVSPQRTQKQEGAPRSLCRTRNPRVIVLVDDDRDVREMTRRLLELWGHRVETAEDGPGGIELIVKLEPQVALIDIALPGMDGYRVAQQVRATEPRVCRPRLIAMTGYGRDHDRERALASGFDFHLVKPATPEQLQRLIEGENGESNGQS